MITKNKQNPRIVMVVNNPGSQDNRVVRAAEASSRYGYDVHVVGLIAPGFSAEESINNVTYHRAALGPKLVGLFLDSLPDGIQSKLLQRWLARRSKANYTSEIKESNLTAKPQKTNFELGLGSFTFKRPWEFFPMLINSLQSRVQKMIRSLIPKRPNKLKNRLSSGINKTIQGLPQGISHYDISIKTRLLELVSVLLPKLSQGSYLTGFLPKLMELKADIYYANELPSLSVCSIAAKAHKAKLVYDSHELEPHRNALWTKSQRQFWTNRERKLIGSVDEVVTVSYSLANELMKMYSLDRVTVVRNTSPLNFEVSNQDIRSSLGLDSDVPLVVFVGLLSFNRGLDLVLSALVKLADYHLATVGPVNNNTLQEILFQGDKLGVRDRIHIHPKVPYSELINFLSTADLSVIPFKNTCRSHFCLLPNKLFESVFAGLPVAASNFPDLALFIEENEVGAVFNPENIEDITKKIKYVYDNRNEMMSPEKVERIRTNNCYEREAYKLHSLYRRLGFYSSI